jgi:hypothetical protein
MRLGNKSITNEFRKRISLLVAIPFDRIIHFTISIAEVVEFGRHATLRW